VSVRGGALVVVEPMRVDDLADAAGIEAPDAITEAQLREELARPWARVWVARESGRALAFLLAWHVADEVHVLNVATAVAHRRRGLATRLLDEVLAFARGASTRLVLLEVRRSNTAAVALYRSRGFYALGLRLRYYANGEDAIEMALELDPMTGEQIPHQDEVVLGPPG